MNYFDLLNIPVSYQIDLDLLDDNLFAQQRKAHPDMAGSEAKSAELNIAYKTLKDNFYRAQYLLQVVGYNPDEAEATTELLMEVVSWREGDIDEQELRLQEKGFPQLMSDLFATKQYEIAQEKFIYWKYLRRFLNLKV